MSRRRKRTRVVRQRDKTGGRRTGALTSLLRDICLVATDVDGVLTDAGMYYAESGDELKKFNTRDGMGLKLLQEAGLVTALITQEDTKLVRRRGEKLAIPEIHQGVRDKLGRLRELCSKYACSLEQVAYMGDDVNDVEALKSVGFSAAPADAVPAVLEVVRYVCRKQGGEGAVREVAEMILAAKAGKQTRVTSPSPSFRRGKEAKRTRGRMR